MSMVAQDGGEIIKAPSNLVIITYVTCPYITKTNIPNLKVCYCPQESYRLLSSDIGVNECVDSQFYNGMQT
jgi:hypothetical protein